MNMKPALLLSLLVFSLFLAAFAFADTNNTIEVKTTTSYEIRSLELDPGKTGDLTVYLKSDGEMLRGFKVALIRDKDRRLLASVQSDPNGIVTFSKLPPGVYTVIVKRSKRQKTLEHCDCRRLDTERNSS